MKYTPTKFLSKSVVEYVSAKKFENIVNELIFKARAYNLLVNLAQKM